MISARAANRRFLFLQGPPGPFFLQLGKELAQHGAAIFRIQLNGGDRYDWPKGGVSYRGTRDRWPAFFDRFVSRNHITDLVLFGDCRPMHEAAVRLAQLRRLNVYVFEEGYIRPDWMTLERDGVNGYSNFQREPRTILEAAQLLPPVPKLPPITAMFRRRARDSYWHYHHVVIGRIAFPFYRSHREGNIMLQGIGWALRFLRARRAVRVRRRIRCRRSKAATIICSRSSYRAIIRSARIRRSDRCVSPPNSCSRALPATRPPTRCCW